MGDGPCELPAHVLADRLRRRELTAAKALEAQLARMARHNPALNAVVSLDAGRARALAAAADAALERGQLQGPLHGVPMTLRGADGLPIGIQLVGPRWSETRLVGIARALEHAGMLPGFEAPPGLSTDGERFVDGSANAC
jgi:Asp-tRNA(Asn)/Glu-tRNA(Gln) amidotransferase A subunit family amidase